MLASVNSDNAKKVVGIYAASNTNYNRITNAGKTQHGDPPVK